MMMMASAERNKQRVGYTATTTTNSRRARSHCAHVSAWLQAGMQVECLCSSRASAIILGKTLHCNATQHSPTGICIALLGCWLVAAAGW